MSNHLGPGQVALYRIGDSLEHIEEWSKNYATHMEPKGGPLNQRDDAKVPEPKSFEDLRGKRSQFYFILDHFKTLLATTYEGNLNEFISAEFPKLSLGIGGNALNPLIRIGYGYSVKSSTLVCEGFAFLHYGYFHFTISSQSIDQLGELSLFTTCIKSNSIKVFDASALAMSQNKQPHLSFTFKYVWK